MKNPNVILVLCFAFAGCFGGQGDTNPVSQIETPLKGISDAATVIHETAKTVTPQQEKHIIQEKAHFIIKSVKFVDKSVAVFLDEMKEKDTKILKLQKELDEANDSFLFWIQTAMFLAGLGCFVFIGIKVYSFIQSYGLSGNLVNLLQSNLVLFAIGAALIAISRMIGQDWFFTACYIVTGIAIVAGVVGYYFLYKKQCNTTVVGNEVWLDFRKLVKIAGIKPDSAIYDVSTNTSIVEAVDENSRQDSICASPKNYFIEDKTRV